MAEQKVTVPNIGDFKEVEVIEVLVKEGQSISKDESIITLESDKSSVEVPSSSSGTIKKLILKLATKYLKVTLFYYLKAVSQKKKSLLMFKVKIRYKKIMR